MEPNKIKIDDVEYIRADSVQTVPATNTDGKPFVIVRSHGAGVFAGYLAKLDKATRSVVLYSCIRLWRWTGATLSQVALDGIAGSGENRFSVPTNDHQIFEVLEVIPCTSKAMRAIQGVPSWKA